MHEPVLDELLEEPIIRKVMLADGYSADDIRLLIKEAGARAGHSSRPAPSDLPHLSALRCCGGPAAANPQPN